MPVKTVYNIRKGFDILQVYYPPSERLSEQQIEDNLKDRGYIIINKYQLQSKKGGGEFYTRSLSFPYRIIDRFGTFKTLT